MRRLLTILSLLSIGFTPSAYANSAMVNDSLVSNLDCHNLTESNVLTHVRPDAFSIERHIPLSNWAANGLGQCAALSLAQRRLFYFLRFSEKDSAPILERTGDFEKILDLLRGRSFESKLPVIATSESSLSRRVGSLWISLESGLDGRDAVREIEASQIKEFYKISWLVKDGHLWGSRDRNIVSNNQTAQKIRQNYLQGRMSFIDLRFKWATQHAVLVKKVKDLQDGTLLITIYDSNNPWNEPVITFKNGHFYVPKEVSGESSSDQPVGVFLQYEQEMDQIQKELFNYYKGTCVKAEAKR